MQFLKRYSLLLISLIMLIGCQNDNLGAIPEPQSPISTPVTLTGDSGIITGNAKAIDKPQEDLKVYLANVDRIESGGYFYFIDTATVPSAPVGLTGEFSITTVPKEYVVLFGYDPEFAVPILGEDGEPKVFLLEKGASINIGSHEVTPR